jgi:hypothetical protein
VGVRLFVVVLALGLFAGPGVADAHFLTKPKAKRAIARWAFELGQHAHGAELLGTYASNCVRWSYHRVWCVANWEWRTLPTDLPGGTRYTCIAGAYATIRRGSWRVRVRIDPTGPDGCFLGVTNGT